MLTQEEMERYAVQMSLCQFGREAQNRLKAASIAVVGAGGLGCPALHYLVTAGIGQITIFDPDQIELKNLHRQGLYHKADIGQAKAQVACDQLASFNPHVDLRARVERITAANAETHLRGFDLVLDASDNFATRYVINDACDALQQHWIYAAVNRFNAQVGLFGPGCLNYRTLYPEPPVQTTTCTENGVVGPFLGIVGSIQALEAIKWIAGIDSPLAGKLLVLDALTWKLHLFF